VKKPVKAGKSEGALAIGKRTQKDTGLIDGNIHYRKAGWGIDSQRGNPACESQ